MAKKRSKTSKKSGGSTLLGIMVGLILGLAAAVAVALFVTQAPMPFVDKASRDPAKTLLPDVRNAPDPNIALSGRPESPASTIQTPEPEIIPPPIPNVPSGDNLGSFISSLPSSSRPKPEVAEPNTLARTQTQYYLQAGAFRSVQDAESIKARILLLGLPVQVQQAQVDGGTINRVRVGPFTGIDQMNQARSKLGTEKIESAVVRP